MSMTAIDEVNTRTDPIERLRSTMCATRISFEWFGTRKSLTRDQKTQAAESFGAEGTFLSAGKNCWIPDTPVSGP